MNESKSLLDKITEDPGFINRGAAEANPSLEAQPVAPVGTVAGAGVSPAPAAKPLPDRVEPLVIDRDPAFQRVVQPNLLPPRVQPVPGSRAKWPWLVTGAVVLVAGGVGAWMYWQGRLAKVAVVPSSPTPAATVTPSPSVSPTPTPAPTPSPSPVATPVPETVTMPAVTPTAEHPQAVTITSKSGLWLRSSPTSANRSNIIGWMPNGATIEVDSVGDFWWHGMYKGRAGYFAVKYTQ